MDDDASDRKIPLPPGSQKQAPPQKSSAPFSQSVLPLPHPRRHWISVRAVGRLRHVDAHHRLLFATGFGLLTFLAFLITRKFPVALIAGWNAFAFVEIALAWIRILWVRAHHLGRTLRLQDSSRKAIFLFVLGGCVASLFAVGYLLGSAKDLSRSRATTHLLLSGATVFLSWILIHTTFTLHYAFLYFRRSRGEGPQLVGNGLEFPGEEHPDLLDFAYFSFVIGMTCQVSDVQISCRKIRRLALLHGLLTFIFNAVILACTINLSSNLL